MLGCNILKYIRNVYVFSDWYREKLKEDGFENEEEARVQANEEEKLRKT